MTSIRSEKVVGIVMAVFLLSALGLSAEGKHEDRRDKESKYDYAYEKEHNGRDRDRHEAGGRDQEGQDDELAIYSDSRLGFSIEYPSTWTQVSADTSGVLLSDGPESIRVELTAADKGLSPKDYALGEAGKLAAEYPGFHQTNLVDSTELKDTAVLGFESQLASPEDNATYGGQADRYYRRLSDGRLAVVTIAAPKKDYDQVQFRDIALSLKTPTVKK